MPTQTRIAIIGAGVVGQTFAQLLADCSQYVVALGSRAQGNMHGAVQDAEVVLLTVSDSAIESVCVELANSFKADAVVAHCSGALTSDILKAHAGPTASMHPLQTFPNVEAALPKVKGTYAYCEGDEAALPDVKALAQALGMQPVEIASKNKPLYHAAAVMACNNLVALMECALKLGEAANINRDIMWQSLKPLIDATVENIDKHGTKDALTGPVARGDIETLRSHLNAIESNSRLDETQEKVYREMASQAAELVDRKVAL
jgi:predicted short-subunit dehydrogenase-like oxidoreductase (DUF2520 family)